ncbi:BamA/TamA family outer membrane protein [Cytophaga hutchinsonii]|uniref:Outer membrane protein n=1 Tax=Cytophaga hutchinsonii (strain ATCC 33406 / DSM 1761 / CIP 103989 / NBRC 15051 / NCIMB 9469 / D465) TaxID=269798 RepID=A0A6N4SS13_CYTH3|nr:BamA/TamA family outer membrane protein [Cytophaga hutchinsonii]ABG59183.1 outer membrane protein [Cytophaga hutchinsonii ATCC 33406]
MKLLYYIFTGILAILLLQGCKPSISYFATDPDYKGKYMLYVQQTKGTKHINNSDINALYRQKAQYKLFGITPYLTIHYIGKSFYDTTFIKQEIQATKVRYDRKITKKPHSEKRYLALVAKRKKKIAKLENKLIHGNWVMGSFGEYPSILDTSVIKYTNAQISNYLSSNGYFNNQVKYNIDTLGRKAFVTYKVNQGNQYKYSILDYDIEDSVILDIVKNTKGTKIYLGDAYNQSKIDLERDRLYKLLKNRGYYEFSKAYINFVVDSTVGNNGIKLTLEIDQPIDNTVHTRYKLNNIIYIPVTGNTDSVSTYTDTLEYHSLKFCRNKTPYNYKILDGKIFTRHNSYFKQDSLIKTQQQLGSMDMYRFVNVNIIKRDSSTLDMLIYTNRLQKFSISQEYGLNVVQGVIPGPFFNVNFRNRNIFGNYEILDFNVRYAIEGQASVLDNQNKLQTIEWGISTSLTFPQLLSPTRIRFKAAKFNAKTRVTFGYNSTQRPEYNRYGFRSQFIYLWETSPYSQFSFTPVDINIINSTINMVEFSEYLNNLRVNGNNLYVSFLPSIVTNMNLTYTFSNNIFGKKTPSFYFRPSFELGGLIPNMINRNITHEDNNRLFGLQYYQYYKLQADFRYYRPIKEKTVLAVRLNVGLSKPFGTSGQKHGNNILPYEKYFFTGGSNSIRAWRYRRLGPGSYANPDETKQYTNEEPGNIVIETNFEFRRKLYSFIEGAYFIDAGNVWLLQEDKTRPGGEFKYFKSVPEIAIGTGAGLRLNFTFIIVRLDVAFKAWDPANALEDRYVLFKFEDKNNRPVYNFSLGYPF